jgi:MFS family permease
LRYVRARPRLLWPIVLVGVVGTFGLNFQITMALMTTQVFHRDAASYGLLSSVLAFGSLLGALLAAARRRVRLRLVVGAAVAFAALEVLTGVMPTYLSFLLMLIPTGVAALTFSTAANATIQMESSASMRGRVMALYVLVFLGGTPIGAPIIGWIAQHFGARWSLLGGGAICLGVGLAVGALLARRSGAPVFARAYPVHATTERELSEAGRSTAS